MFSNTHFIVAVLAWFSFFVAEIEAVNGTSNSTAKVPLRIMALGASVTFGIGSTTGDSYRKDLRDLLVGDGNEVSFVGSLRNGNFSDNAVQAVPGFVIEQIAVAAENNVSIVSFLLAFLFEWKSILGRGSPTTKMLDIGH